MTDRPHEVMTSSPWTLRAARFAWTYWGDTAHEIVSKHRDGSTSVWRRVVFGLYRRLGQ
jgi:hypothetical protein